MKEIKKYGLTFLEVDSIAKDECFNVAKELIENLFFDMSKLSTKYWNDVFRDLPYTYTERRLDSVLLPALSKLCNSMVLVEVPAVRECANGRFHVDESNGRIDYWCIYKNYSMTALLPMLRENETLLPVGLKCMNSFKVWKRKLKNTKKQQKV